MVDTAGQCKHLAVVAHDARPARVLAPLLLVGLALHSWPAGDFLQLLWPATVILMIWVAGAAIWAGTATGRAALAIALPPACVWAYMATCVLSIAAAENPARASVAAGKIVLSILGTYTLLAVALTSQCSRRWILTTLVASSATVLAYALWQSAAGVPVVAFLDSPLKLGTFLAMTVTAASAFLLRLKSWLARPTATVLVAGALTICPSAWACLGVVVGVIVGAFLTGNARRWVVVTAVVCTACVVAAATAGRLPPWLADLRLMETDGVDVRQRYIEWQAELNLLSDRAGAGAGIGCLNDHRSTYYLRLPKRNTIAEFDQNGWLATAAETGLVGLLALSWVFYHYWSRAYQLRRDFAASAALAGLIGAAISNMGSALQYAGILPAFVLLLALVDSATTAGDTEGR
ncbi:MAG TPA: hypothetical protein VMZ31_05140 [Phycisphaerae bacterium]|nr:hypothetical protein [Phycisphaerae bacterium]